MFPKRPFWLVLCLLTVALAVGCSSSEPPAEEEPPPEAAAAPEPDVLQPGDEAEEPIDEDVPDPGYPVVEMQTNLGMLKIELYPDKAPKTVQNFIDYVNDGFYDGTIFHRVVPDFVIQGGGFTPDMNKKETRAPIENEADNGLRNLRGTICMARTNDPHSATSQFFINTKDNPPLDHQAPSLQGWGYAVFGKVTEGLEIVDQIEDVSTTTKDGYRNVPVDAVVIESARLVS